MRSTFDPLLDLVAEDPARAVEDAWPPLRQVALEVHRALLAHEPRPKVIDMVAELAAAGRLEAGWVDVSYPLYYWPIDQDHQLVPMSRGSARTYLSLAESLAIALLLAADSERTA